MSSSEDASNSAAGHDLSSLFDFLPIGAYRSLPDGTMLRANPALVRLNGYASEAEMLADVRDIARDWYVDPARRDEFRARLERDGQVIAFVSEIYRYKTRERVWVSENAHLLRDKDGRVLFYEGTVEEVTARVEAEAALQRSEQQLRDIAARVPGFVYQLRVEPGGRRHFSFVSEGVHDLLGVTPQALQRDGGLIRKFHHPEDRERVAQAMDEARESGTALRLEFRVVLADGTVKWVQMSSSQAASDSSSHVRVGVMVDITALKQSEAALRESEQRWKLALESVGDGVWDWNLVTGEEVVSPQLLAIYGLDAAEHGQRADALDERTHPDDLAPMQAAREAHLAGRTPAYVNEHRVRGSDGEWKWVLSRGMVIERDPDGRPLRMIGTHTDIGERRAAESLRAERDRAAAAQKAQTAFLSRVSHELRTPLNAIIGFAQLLELERVGTSRQAGWVHTIIDSGNHLLALVNDLLDLSSAQTGQLQFTNTSLDLAAVLRQAWTMHAADAAAAGVLLDDRLPEAGAVHVAADGTRLKQVLSNLLSNAIKYNRPGGRITATARREGDSVVLRVEDNGQGMAEDQLARLFTPFERAGAQHSSIAGTGLGLALARQLTESMGGRIDVQSTPGQGSVFSVQLNASGACPPA
jgi:PAS domain S-box-containing protein